MSEISNQISLNDDPMDDQKTDQISLSLNPVSIKDRAEEFGIDYLSEAPDKIQKEVLNIISEDVAKRYRMVAFERDGSLLKVAMETPSDNEALNIIRFLAQKEKVEVIVLLADAPVLDEMLKQYSAAEKFLKQAILSLGETDISDDLSQGPKKTQEIKEVLSDAPVAKLVQVVIRHAVDGRASDIHIEPIDEGYRVRFRVDGVLHASLSLPMDVGKAIVSHIKILSNLKIDEKRKPQDGRFRFNMDNGQNIDLRVSTFPVVEGEKIVMRILDKSKGLASLDVLGLMGRNHDVLTRKILEPFGIILMTGPTGSGKSTSLYAFLKILNQEERNIVTLEDPVEYFLEGINQSQVKPEIGYTFASGLRSILRQDPNVIMVGEIRDSETAELAIHAALTGHLVFSTLHTNDALGSIPRLVDMGIEPFLLASSLQAVAAQRLVRRICDTCKETMELPPKMAAKVAAILEKISPEEVKKYGIDVQQGLIFYHGKGCKECNNTGYKGRIALHEVFEITPQAQDVISVKQDSEVVFKKEAERQGMLMMQQDGLLKALKGLTTVSEVERVTEGAHLVDEE